MKKWFIHISILMVGVVSAQSQTLSLGIDAGFSMMQPTEYHRLIYLGNTWTYPGRFEEITDRGLDKGCRISGKLHYTLNTKPLSIISGITYARYSGKAGYYLATVPPWFSTINTGSFQIKREDLTFFLGGGYGFPSIREHPHVSLLGLLTRFGETKMEMTSSYNVKLDDPQKIRGGVAVGAGLNLPIMPYFAPTVEIKYLLVNLIGREQDENLLSAFSLNLGICHDLFTHCVGGNTD